MGAIDLDNQARRQAREVREVRPDWHLPPELETAQFRLHSRDERYRSAFVMLFRSSRARWVSGECIPAESSIRTRLPSQAVRTLRVSLIEFVRPHPAGTASRSGPTSPQGGEVNLILVVRPHPASPQGGEVNLILVVRPHPASPHGGELKSVWFGQVPR